MRKIELDMIAAIHARKNWKSGNTKVMLGTDNSESLVEADISAQVYLHGNMIAEYTYATGKLVIWDGGWESRTTKSRLNAILSEFAPSYGIVQRDYAWKLLDSMLAHFSWMGEHVFRGGQLVS